MPEDADAGTERFASPACLMHEVDRDYLGLGDTSVEAQRAAIMRWRKSERERLIAARLALDAQERAQRSQRLFAHLDALLPQLAGRVVSLYWPYRGEPDPRAWLDAIRARGATTALPVVVEKGAPMAFRASGAGDPLTRDALGIPVPTENRKVTPDFVLAPVVGFDRHRFRLGYGGGYFDRTLAAMTPKPKVIGVGYTSAAIATIYPLPHDIVMDIIVTDEGVI